MKNSWKKLLKVGILTFIIALLYRCSNEESAQSETVQEKKVKTISLNDFKANVNKGKSFDKISALFDVNRKELSTFQYQNKNIDQNTDLTILTDEIRVIELGNQTTYTFKVLTGNNDNTNFYNLVVHIDLEQNIVKSEFIEYRPTQLWLSDTSKAYEGELKIVENDFLDLGNLFASRRQQRSCYPEIYGGWECNLGNNHAPGEGASCTSWTYWITIEQNCTGGGGGTGSTGSGSGTSDNNGNPTDGGGSGSGGTTNPWEDNNEITPTSPMVPDDKEFDMDHVTIENCISISSASGLNLLNAEQKSIIADFINTNGCSNKKIFIEEAIEILIDNGEVDFEEELILDSDLKDNDCLYSVYTGMGKAPTFANYLNNFDGDMSVANLKLTSSTTLDANTNAETSAPQNYLITITFNENNLDRPILSIARTFIHEMIHAETFRKLLSVAQHPSIQLDQNQLIQLRNDYPGLYDYYMRWKWNVPQGQSPSSAQHEAMAQHYRDIIKQALKEFDNSQTDEIYEALAWTGLKNTVAWNNLTQTKRDSINQTITDFNTNNPNCQ
jgi:hypothetical protein